LKNWIKNIKEIETKNFEEIKKQLEELDQRIKKIDEK
jgi:hypothetical protein